MLFIALMTILMMSSSAQDFTLVQVENSTYRDYSREELMARLGSDSALLASYGCNSQNENDPFWPALRTNPSRKSLRIKVHKSEKILFYREGVYYTQGGEVEVDLSNLFVTYVVQALKQIEAFPEGAQLLRELEQSHYPLTIDYGGNSFIPQTNEGRNYHGIYQANALSIIKHGRMSNENISFESIGAGGTISWDPKTPGVPAHVALAHEMYHAFDSIRGLLDMRLVKGEKYEQAFVSEYRAVYLENLARRVVGFELRRYYGKNQVGPGMLDEAGEPRRMAAPCL